MSKKNKEEVYMLTPLGFLGNTIYDKLLLYMYKTKNNAIVINDDGDLEFTQVEKKEA